MSCSNRSGVNKSLPILCGQDSAGGVPQATHCQQGHIRPLVCTTLPAVFQRSHHPNFSTSQSHRLCGPRSRATVLFVLIHNKIIIRIIHNTVGSSPYCSTLPHPCDAAGGASQTPPSPPPHPERVQQRPLSSASHATLLSQTSVTLLDGWE